MSEGPSEMMQRLAAEFANSADAPSEAEALLPNATSQSEVAYDVGLQEQLIELGPETLAEYGRIEVREMGDPARYNSAIWYALAQGLRYDLRDDVLVIYAPEEET